MSDYLIDKFVALKAGEAFRLFPFGKLVKNGKTREITQELAARFRLPHFKPPIKLGSHREETPAGGFITQLEVRADGLYGVPEFNEKGTQAMSEGAYRYHSPEVIWEGGGLEDPTTGEAIPGPLITGVALLHTPHLGEAAALYTIEEIEEVKDIPITEEKVMTDTVQVPANLWEKFMNKMFPEKPEIEPEPDKETQVDEMSAIIHERDEMKAELDRIKAEVEHASKVDDFAAQLKETKVSEADGAAEKLAELPEELAGWVVQQFKALSAQINESALLAENGGDIEGDPDADPKTSLDTVVHAKMKELKIDYNAALDIVWKDQPEKFTAAYK